MLKKISFALMAALLLNADVQATPTRLLTVDNMTQIVPDDYDATHYYALAPNFKNNWYWDSYSSGKSYGWAFIDTGIGTLVVWYNKPFEGGALYDAATSYSPAAITGLSLADLTATITNAWDPREKRVKTPDNKVALGYAIEALDNLNFGFCFRLAQVGHSLDSENQNGVGAPGAGFGASNAYQAGLGGGYAGLTTHKYSNTQSSNGMVVSPQFSFIGESFTLDAKFDMVWAGIDNKHQEELVSGVKTGTVSQTLKDQGRMSWYARPKLRYMLDNSSSLVLRGSYGVLDLSTEHRVKGSFSGAGYSAQELAGFDFADSTQELAITQWDVTVGYLKTWDSGKNLFLLGVVPKGQTAHLVATNYQTRATATTYNDVVKNSIQDTTLEDWAVPLVIGSELSLAKWCKARASMQRNIFSGSSSKTTSDTHDNTGTLTARTLSKSSSDAATNLLGPGWVVNSGFGLDFGSFSWDTALNTTFLASNNAAYTNPLFKRSYTYGF